MINLVKLNKILPFEIGDEKLLKEIFVHSSYLNESEGEGLESNERLEFLGDAILESVISHILFSRFPDLNEGELTKLRASLVNKRMLSEISSDFSLGDFLLLGKGERASGGGTENPSILADTFEALIAALYIDKKEDGYREAYDFIDLVFSPLIEEALNGPRHFDFKPALQEYCQGNLKKEPHYKVINVEGPPHLRVFEVVVIVDKKTLGTGKAPRKKEAEQLAAKEALKALTE
ncbi:MAG: ribonuclease III [Proteobacteria bacterium]|nr:ribonuclease III [Pseudomonadota bacterium]